MQKRKQQLKLVSGGKSKDQATLVMAPQIQPRTSKQKQANPTASLVWHPKDNKSGINLTYQRQLDLPRLLPLWPAELKDHSPAGTRTILTHIRKALRQERRRARQRQPTYNLQRHLGLLAAERAEQHRLDTMSN